jgi:xylulose-5-phosphate/fructose-6-phosphate phosphoketolase
LDELLDQLEGHGHRPYVVEGGFDGEDPMAVHERMAVTLDEIVAEIARIRATAKEQADAGEPVDRPRWPALVLCTPKGWTGPKVVDGKPVEGTWRAHQVPLSETRDNDEHRAQLEEWLRSYRPDELFDDDGRLVPELRALSPAGAQRMSATPHANGGELLRDLRLPDFTVHAVDVPEPGTGSVSATGTAGKWLASPRTRRASA